MATREEVMTAAAIKEFRMRHKLRHGTKVFVIIRSVSSSGMHRTMDFYIIKGEGHRRDLVCITHHFIKILGWGRAKDGAMRVRGTGMNMVFHAVHSFSMRTYKDPDYLQYVSI